MAFSVGQVATASALNAVTLNSTSATVYTPALTNIGSATFTTLTGWYYTIGSGSGCLVFFTAYFAVNAGGSGSSKVTITSPTNPDRTTRQVVPGLRETGGTSHSEGVIVSFTGGATNVWDRLVHGAADILGSDLSSGAIHVYTGWYRQA